MKIPFYKFHGNGNDFILIDGMTESVILTTKQIQDLCHRRFGIGADGLMLIQPSASYSFTMKYFNSDGLESTMCGNGGRCISALAFYKGYVEKSFSFEAIDGIHLAVIDDEVERGSQWNVSLKMLDVVGADPEGDDFILDTGSPHLVRFVNDVESLDVYSLGRKLRQVTRPDTGGVNVNFVQMRENSLYVRTYERGVENETLSCGTGVTASAIAAGIKIGQQHWLVETRGGNFKVDFVHDSMLVSEVWLRGPATLVFQGEVNVL